MTEIWLAAAMPSAASSKPTELGAVAQRPEFEAKMDDVLSGNKIDSRSGKHIAL